MTLDEQDTLTLKKKKIKIIPAWKWMLEDNSRRAILKKSP
jgi:hypothetical protein